MENNQQQNQPHQQGQGHPPRIPGQGQQPLSNAAPVDNNPVLPAALDTIPHPMMGPPPANNGGSMLMNGGGLNPGSLPVHIQEQMRRQMQSQMMMQQHQMQQQHQQQRLGMQHVQQAGMMQARPQGMLQPQAMMQPMGMMGGSLGQQVMPTMNMPVLPLQQQRPHQPLQQHPHNQQQQQQHFQSQQHLQQNQLQQQQQQPRKAASSIPAARLAALSQVRPYSPSMDESAFMHSLTQFLSCVNIPLRKPPTIMNSPVNLMVLFKAVTGFGGFQRVSETRRWQAVAGTMGLPPGNMDVLSTLHSLYGMLLSPYEQFMIHRVPAEAINCTSMVH